MSEQIKFFFEGLAISSYFTGAIALISFICAYRLFESEKKHKPHPIIFSAIGALFVLLTFYLNGSKVNYEELGTPAQFGQLGDFIGGILNPIFGFITLLMLVESYKITQDTNRITQQTNQITRATYETTKASHLVAQTDSHREARKFEKQEIKSMIEDFKNQLNLQLSEKNIRLIYVKPFSINEIVQSADRSIIRGITEDIIKLKNKIYSRTYDTQAERSNYAAIFDVRTTVNNINELYFALVDENESSIVNKFTIRNFEKFLYSQTENELLTPEEYHAKLDEVEEKSGTKDTGLSRKHPRAQHISDAGGSGPHS